MNDFIVFDKSSLGWNNGDEEEILWYLRCKKEYINGLLMCRGYIYLNQIYESLGVKWDSTRMNTCIRYNDNNHIEFHITKKLEENYYLINVYWY